MSALFRGNQSRTWLVLVQASAAQLELLAAMTGRNPPRAQTPRADEVGKGLLCACEWQCLSAESMAGLGALKCWCP